MSCPKEIPCMSHEEYETMTLSDFFIKHKVEWAKDRDNAREICHMMPTGNLVVHAPSTVEGVEGVVIGYIRNYMPDGWMNEYE